MNTNATNTNTAAPASATASATVPVLFVGIVEIDENQDKAPYTSSAPGLLLHALIDVLRNGATDSKE